MVIPFRSFLFTSHQKNFLYMNFSVCVLLNRIVRNDDKIVVVGMSDMKLYDKNVVRFFFYSIVENVSLEISILRILTLFSLAIVISFVLSCYFLYFFFVSSSSYIFFFFILYPFDNSLHNKIFFFFF